MEALGLALAKLWTWFMSVFPMFFGVAIALNADAKKLTDLTNKQILAAFFFGVGISYYFSNFVAENWVINPLSATFILMEVFTAAIGMSVMGQLITAVPVQISKILDALRSKWFGG